MDNRIEAFRGVLKANGRILYNGVKVKIKYKSNNILNVKYIGYDYENDLFEFERKSNLLKKAIMRIPTVQINHRELYAVW